MICFILQELDSTPWIVSTAVLVAGTTSNSDLSLISITIPIIISLSLLMVICVSILIYIIKYKISLNFKKHTQYFHIHTDDHEMEVYV